MRSKNASMNSNPKSSPSLEASQPFSKAAFLALFVGWFLAAFPAIGQTSGDKLRLCVSTPDLESLAKEIGGPRVTVFCFSQGPQDPHEIEVRPSFVRELNTAHLYAQVGLGIENAWLKNLLSPVKNEAVKPGGKGNLNVGQFVRPLEGEAGQPIPNSYHEEGNPHYLLDPIEGLKAARALRDHLTQLRPEWKAEFNQRFDQFRLKLTVALAGEECAGDDIEKLALLFEQARTAADLKKLHAEHKVGGWLGAMSPHRGKPIVGDHDLWPYFARRCGLEVLGYLEPSPGVPPTTKHLRELVERMKQRNVRVILAAPYFEQRHALFVAKNTGAKVLPMCHQTGAHAGTDNYLIMVKHNFTQLITALNAK
jgi:ABC-type Zn uptake system ZnuABC Zn-binding protein ZnuA